MGGPLRVVRVIYVLGFAEGTGDHLYELITRGLSAYYYAPPAIAVFFHLLLLIDPGTALVVLRRRSFGPALAAAVMTGDLLANGWVNWPDVRADPWQFVRPYGLLVLTLFGLFVFVTAVPLHRATRGSGSGRRAVADHVSSPESPPVPAAPCADAPSEG